MIATNLSPAVNRLLAFALLLVLAFFADESVRKALPYQLFRLLPALTLGLSAFCGVIAIITAVVDRMDGEHSSLTYAEFGRKFLNVGLIAAAFGLAQLGAESSDSYEVFVPASQRTAIIFATMIVAFWYLTRRGEAAIDAPIPPRPGADSPPGGTSVKRRSSLPVWRIIGIAAAVPILLVLSSLLYLSRTYPQNFREYRLYLTETRPALDLAFDEISEEWTELDVKARFPQVRFYCGAHRPGTYPGDRHCAADIGSHNGSPAMTGTFYWTDGKLTQFGVTTPSWTHRAQAVKLQKTLGRPAAAQKIAIGGDRLVGWQLPGKHAVLFNRDQPRLLEWNLIYWQSARACPENGCFIDR